MNLNDAPPTTHFLNTKKQIILLWPRRESPYLFKAEEKPTCSSDSMSSELCNAAMMRS